MTRTLVFSPEKKKSLDYKNWIITINGKINVWKCKRIFPTDTLQQKMEITDLNPFLAAGDTSVLIILATAVHPHLSLPSPASFFKLSLFNWLGSIKSSRPAARPDPCSSPHPPCPGRGNTCSQPASAGYSRDDTAVTSEREERWVTHRPERHQLTRERGDSASLSVSHIYTSSTDP